MNYYHRFKIIIGTPLWRQYLRWAYRTCIKDFKRLNFTPNFKKDQFTCLLCGCGNETTADEFIKFVTKRNPRAKIIIIDLADEQVNAIRKLVNDSYCSLDIRIKQINALKLDAFIKNHSLDWIETDGFLEYFDKKALGKLLRLWNKLLKTDGFITLREPAGEGGLGRLLDRLKIWVGKIWLGVTVYSHSKLELEELLEKCGFRYVWGRTIIPTFLRFSLIKH